MLNIETLQQKLQLPAQEQLAHLYNAEFYQRVTRLRQNVLLAVGKELANRVPSILVNIDRMTQEVGNTPFAISLALENAYSTATKSNDFDIRTSIQLLRTDGFSGTIGTEPDDTEDQLLCDVVCHGIRLSVALKVASIQLQLKNNSASTLTELQNVMMNGTQRLIRALMGISAKNAITIEQRMGLQSKTVTIDARPRIHTELDIVHLELATVENEVHVDITEQIVTDCSDLKPMYANACLAPRTNIMTESGNRNYRDFFNGLIHTALIKHYLRKFVQ